jgi:hypothetical protein
MNMFFVPSIPLRRASRSRQGGLFLLQFLMALIVLGVLMGSLLGRLDIYQEHAERVAVQQIVVNVRSALQALLAQARLPGHTLDLASLPEQNPFDWLAKKPGNYVGALDAREAQNVEVGKWYFNKNEKVLVYLPRDNVFSSNASSSKLKFKVKLIRLPTSPDKTAGAQANESVTFEQMNE